MERYIILRKEFRKDSYVVIDLLTSRFFYVSSLWMRTFIEYRKIDNLRFNEDGQIELTWQPERIDSSTWIIAKTDEDVLLLSYNGSDDSGSFLMVESRRSLVDEHAYTCNLYEILKKIPDLTHVNDKVEKFNIKASLICHPVKLFPINDKDALLYRYPSERVPLNIPVQCNTMTLGYNMNRECADLSTIKINSGHENIRYFGAWLFDSGSHVDISKFKNIKEIGHKACVGCGCDCIEIPESCEYVGEEAFAASTAIKLIINAKDIELAPRAFLNCTSLKYIEVNGNASLGAKTFYDCRNLRSIKFNGVTKYIPIECFYKCYDIREVVLPKGLEEIDESAFEGCETLEKIVVRESSLEYYNIRKFINTIRKRISNIDISVKKS